MEPEVEFFPTEDNGAQTLVDAPKVRGSIKYVVYYSDGQVVLTVSILRRLEFSILDFGRGPILRPQP